MRHRRDLPVPAGRLRALADPAAIPTKLCPDRHPNNPSSARCGFCEHRFGPLADIVPLAPMVLVRLLLEDGAAVDLARDLVVGRSPTGDEWHDTLTIGGRQVSRTHLRLETRGWSLFVEDCDSTNGTFLSRAGERGRRRVRLGQALAVRVGDSIHFGSRQALVVPAR